ncbi:MAG: AraC family transcriptional regulator [Lentisphaeria bacterium]|nr:AraC family transcriptional regulator [Lentisphaeria bacterium]
MIEQPFLRSEHQGKFQCERTLLARNRIPFLNTGVLFLAGYGESEFLPGKEISPGIFQPYWSFQLVTKGTLCFEQQGEGTFKAEKGDFFLTRPGHSYFFRTEEGEMLEKRYIMVSHGVLVTLLCEQGSLADRTVFHHADVPYVSRVFDSIRDLALSGGEDMQRRLSVITYDFLLHMIPDDPQEELPGGLSRIIGDIHSDITGRFTLKNMSAKYGIGERTLCRLFRKYLNCTPIQYVIRTRMMYAKRMLQSEGLGIENIARACGYRNFAFFSKEFRRLYGLTPGEYRNEQLISEKKVTLFFHTEAQKAFPGTPFPAEKDAPPEKGKKKKRLSPEKEKSGNEKKKKKK